MATKKKRLTIAFTKVDLEIVEKLKVHLNTKQISKVISYSLNYTFLNDSVLHDD